MSKIKGRILVVDDNEELLLAFKLMLKRHVEKVETLNNPNRLLEELKVGYELVLLDMNFNAGVHSGNEGIYWLRQIKAVYPGVEVVFITAYGDVQLAVKSIKEGAVDFIQKSWDEEKIISTILAAFRIRDSKQEIFRLKEKQAHLSKSLNREYAYCDLPSQPMQELMKTVAKVAPTDANVLILGENGTGKEVIAREIHRLSSRANELFVSVDVGSIAPSLFESELFGHEKGAFTDAKQARAGRFEIASSGTLFLDEIANTSPTQQQKLLSVIQNKTVTRVGSNEQLPADVRLVCATNASIHGLVESGDFREDLLYRVNTIEIEIPQLRDRQEDIPVLANYFLDRFLVKYRKSKISISRSGIDKLQKHSWSGNIRELQHVMEKAVILCDGTKLSGSDFSFSKSEKALKEPQTFDITDNERLLVGRALDKFGNNMTQTAKALGINRSTLYDKIRKYGL